MATVVHRVTGQVLVSVNTPDYVPGWSKGDPAPSDGDWIVNPDLKAVDGVPVKHRKVVKGAVVPMDDGERAAVDAAEAEAVAVREKQRLLALDSDVKKASVEAEKAVPIG